MRTPLQDSLVKNAVVPAGTHEAVPVDAAQRLAELFRAAQAAENQYASERLSELHQLAERALTLGAAEARRQARPKPAHAPWPARIASLAAGGLLAACAPLVAEASILLAAASGIAALAALAAPFMRGKPPPLPALPSPERADAQIEGVASAADRALQAMVEPRALPSPRTGKGSEARPDEDVLGLVQDALALEGRDGAPGELAENAARLARHLGFEPVWEGGSDLFETMVDPSVAKPLTLRPALVHPDPARSVAGVRVRGR